MNMNCSGTVCATLHELTHARSLRRARGRLWLFTIYKRIAEILVGNFRSVRTVRIVYHLPKISGLSRRARLDSSYNMKMVRNSRNL